VLVSHALRKYRLTFTHIELLAGLRAEVDAAEVFTSAVTPTLDLGQAVDRWIPVEALLPLLVRLADLWAVCAVGVEELDSLHSFAASVDLNTSYDNTGLPFGRTPRRAALAANPHDVAGVPRAAVAVADGIGDATEQGQRADEDVLRVEKHCDELLANGGSKKTTKQ
jgi:hypothetical protein